MRHKYTLRSHLLWVWLAAMSAGAGEDKGMVFSGSYDYIVRPDNRPPAYSARYTFEVSVAGDKWIIAYENVAAAKNPKILNARSIASCDGTNVYLLQYQNEGAQRMAWGNQYEAVKSGLPVALAEIFPGSYPPPREFVLEHLWFAFASGPVLAGGHGRIRPPSYVDLAIFYDTNFVCSYSIQTNAGLPGVREITLRSDGTIPSRNKKTGELKYLVCNPPYDKGYTNGQGVWRGKEEPTGVFVPREFEYTEYAPAAARKDGGLLKAYTYKCVVTNVASAELGPLPAGLPEGRVLVTDRRFISDGYAKVDYVTTRGWIAADDPYVTDQLKNRPKLLLEEEAVAHLSLPPSQADTIRRLIWILIPLPLAFFLARGLWERQKNKQNPRKE